MTAASGGTSPLLRDILDALGPRVAQHKTSGEILCWCPFHRDGEGNPPHHPNLTIKPGTKGAAYVWACPVCNKGGTLLELADRLRAIGVMAPRDGERPSPKFIATYDYRDEEGNLLYQVCRLPNKAFPQRRQDNNGDWIWGLGDTRRALYHLPHLLAADPGQWVFVPEGEKDADALADLGLVVTTNSEGAGKWREEFGPYLQGRRVAILPDNDGPGLAHAQDVARKLKGHAAEVRIVNLPGLPPSGDVSDWLAQGHTAEELRVLVEATPIYVYPSDVGGKVPPSVSSPDTGKSGATDTAESAPATLADVEEVFSRWLLMPDMGGLHFALAILAGHRIGGDPLWGLLVAPPSGTKTEIIRALEAVKGIYPLSELTARTFASGLESGKRETSLLPRLTDHILTLKDFTTVLTMHREERQAILAQLREIYDGRFDKVWGTGKELHWRGRLGFLAGVTPIIDLHHAVHQVLGERFVLYRLEQPDRRTMAVRALRGRGHEEEMRHELQDVMVRFVGSLDYDTPPILPSSLEPRFAALADFVSRARSGVVRERYNHDLSLAPQPEAPARLAKQLASLAIGRALLRAADEVEEADYAFVYRVALDCLPQVRLQVVEVLEGANDYLTTSQVAGAITYPTTTARRTLEDLAAIGIVAIRKAEKQGQADNWQLADEARSLLDISTAALSPESELDTKTGSVPPTSTGAHTPPDDGPAPNVTSSATEDDVDDDAIPQEFTGQRHLVVALGLELGFPNVIWPSNGKDRPTDGIPCGRFHYLQAARYFDDADIQKAVAALEAMEVGQ